MLADLAEKKVELQRFAARYGLRDDWHEPDEQDVSAIVTGVELDNAYCEDQQGIDPLYQELVVHLFVGETRELSINLASLLALAAA